MVRSSQHVVPSANNTWSVRRSGAVKASKIFTNKTDAEKYAIEIAKKQHISVYVHYRDGMIEKKIDVSPQVAVAKKTTVKSTAKPTVKSTAKPTVKSASKPTASKSPQKTSVKRGK